MVSKLREHFEDVLTQCGGKWNPIHCESKVETLFGLARVLSQKGNVLARVCSSYVLQDVTWEDCELGFD